MLKITKVWSYTEYLGEWILQFYPIIYNPPPPPSWKWRSYNLAWKGLSAQITF